MISWMNDLYEYRSGVTLHNSEFNVDVIYQAIYLPLFLFDLVSHISYHVSSVSILF